MELNLNELERRTDALAATVRALSEIVTTPHETKDAFIARVRFVLSSCPDERVLRAVEIEREECAKLCDELAEDRWNLYKGRSPYSGREDGRANPQTQGETIGAECCAAAIRARNESPKGKEC